MGDDRGTDRSPPEDGTLNDNLAAASKTVTTYGPVAIDGLLDQIAEQVIEGVGFDDTNALDLMKTLKGKRGYEQMLALGEVLSDWPNFEFQQLRCQARIDTGDVRGAVYRLKRLMKQPEVAESNKLKSETLGLLGRASKQFFVRLTNEGDIENAALALREAVQYYGSAYPLDVSWHGPNLAALAWRAEREGIFLDITARGTGEKLLKDIGQPINPDPWTISAIAQGLMAAGDWVSGSARYGEYLDRLAQSQGRDAAFMLNGDIRQLTEIWTAGQGLVTEADSILEAARSKVASVLYPHTDTADKARFLSAFDAMGERGGEELQAMVASGAIAPVEELLCVLKNSDTVARISNAAGYARGTGFLVEARSLGISGVSAVFVTNNHVVASALTESTQTAPEDARIEFCRWQTRRAKFRIREILAESPLLQNDITVAILEDLPPDTPFAKLSPMGDRFIAPGPKARSLGRVHPIGHPGGGPLSLSLAGNEVIDHDLHRGPRGVRRLHYKANTEKGNSGSPVFGSSGNVVAVHRAATDRKISGSPVQHDPRYWVNEGVGIGSIVSWFQETMSGGRKLPR